MSSSLSPRDDEVENQKETLTNGEPEKDERKDTSRGHRRRRHRSPATRPAGHEGADGDAVAPDPEGGANDDMEPLIISNAAGPSTSSVAVNIAPLDTTPPVEEIFKRMATIPMAALGIFTNLVMILLVFLLPILCEGHRNGSLPVDLCPLQPFSILVYTHAGHWVVHLIVDQYLKQKHKKSRMDGYIDFYVITKNTRRVPFYLVSVGNALLLVTVTALADYCEQHSCTDKFDKVDYLRGLITLECLLILCLWGYYIIKVREFHATAAPPDALAPEAKRKMAMYSQNGEEERLVRVAGLNQQEREDILEKQAELIGFLHAHIDKQNLKIVALDRQVDSAARF